MRLAMLSMMLIALALSPARAENLTLSLGDASRSFTAAELLARPDAKTIEVPDDVSYQRTMQYRAVPLLALLGADVPASLDTVEARAADGFVSQIPLGLIRKGADGGSTAWVAVEDPSKPWPPLPGKNLSAGPFYIVWLHPERSSIGSEQWPYQTVAITGVESPGHRWPQMNVAGDLAADAPARRGQEVFTTQCMPCHKMNGAGVGELGPDLGQPMNPTRYMTTAGLRALIRDPKSVRTWPQQIMPPFDDKKLSETDLDAVIAYLDQMARQ